jgi:isopentenyldiphosphate isomerase
MSDPPPSDEWIDAIDEHDRVVGKVTRRQMRAENLWHRCVGIFCFDPGGRIYVHRRSDDKDVFPGLYDMSVGGVVAAGEHPDAAARREIAEELGIVGPAPEPLFRHRYEDAHSRSWTSVYRVNYGGPIRHQPSEIAWGRYCTVEEVAENPHGWVFVPDGWQIFMRFLAIKRE